MGEAEYDSWWRERGSGELRDLLYREWDPIGVKDLANGSEDEFDAYVGQIGRRLRAGASEDELAALLEHFRLEMGLEPADLPLGTARGILAWYREARPT